jgi:nitrite reductase (NADH) large subunit
LKKLGKEVKVKEIFPRLLPNQLDEQGAEIIKKQIERLGIEIRLKERTSKVLGSDKVTGILLKSGEIIQGDLLIICTGVRPNIYLAKRSGIEVNKGIIVDKFLKTSVMDICAIGDLTEFQEKVYTEIPAAIDQARIAVKNMIWGDHYKYKGTIPSNTLKIAGLYLSSVGVVNPDKQIYEVIKKINFNKGIYKKIVIENGKIVGELFIVDLKESSLIKKLMDEKIDILKNKDLLNKEDAIYGNILI